MRLDDLARRAAERARRAASAIAADMDPHGYRRRSVSRAGLALTAAAVALATVVVVLVVPEPDDPVALTTTTTLGETTTTVPTVPLPDPGEVAPPPLLGGGWEELIPGPLAARYRPSLDFQSRVSATWTGSELFVWDPAQPGWESGRLDAFLYDLETGFWREAVSYPDWTCPSHSEAVTFRAGDHVVVTSRAQAGGACTAAYHVATDTWMPLDGDLFRRIDRRTPVVWTGQLLVAPTLGLAYDWRSGETIPAPRLSGDADVEVASPQRAHWTDDRVLAIGSGPLRAWTPGDDEWETLADPPLPERARDSVWTDDGLLVVNYDMATAFYADGAWARPGDLPLRFFECGTEAYSIAGTPAVLACSGIALWDQVRASWVVVSLHDVDLTSWPGIAATDDSLYAVGRTFLRRFRLERNDDGSIVVPPTIPIGVMQLDVPDGFAFVSSFAPEQDPAGFIGEDSTIGFVFTADGGRRCVVSSEYRGGDLITEETFGTVVVVRPGRSPIEAVILGASANAVRLAVEASTSDVVTVFCEASLSGDGDVADADGRAFLAGLWSPWEELPAESEDYVAHEVRGLRFEAPSDWFVGDETLTLRLGAAGGLVEVFATGTYPLRPGTESGCEFYPMVALADLGSADALMMLWRLDEVRPGGDVRGPMLGEPYTFEWLEEQGFPGAPACLSRIDTDDLYLRLAWFSGWNLLMVALGPDVSDETRDQVLRVLDSMEWVDD